MAQAATTEPAVNGTVTPNYRRNGKPFSCEPCRRGKLKCGHELPTCSRCIRRGKQVDCYYHEAPMTKSRSPIQKPSKLQSTPSRSATLPQIQSLDSLLNSQPAPLPRPSQPTGHPGAFPQPGRFRSSSSVPLGKNTPSSGTSPLTSSSSHARYASLNVPTVQGVGIMKDNIGFLGSSAYSAVFTENQRSLGLQDEEPERSSSPSPISQDKIHRGAELLTVLRDLNVFRTFIARWFQITDGITIIKPMYKCWLDGIDVAFGPLLSSYKSVEELYPLSELVWRNTEKSPPIDCNTTAAQWGALHTAQNLRWETVAALCTVVSIVALDLSDWDPAFNAAQTIASDRHELTNRMTEGMETGLAFCRDCESITDLYLCVLFESVLVIEAIRGDTHFLAWGRIGDVVNTTIHLGLHQVKRQDENTSFFVNETRIRLFDLLYGHDKSLSTFLGRPPRLSYRYCILNLPMDLSDDEMFLEGEELQRAIDALDDGWNTQGRLHRATWRRVWAAHAQLREDILEITLGTDDQHLIERADQIREKVKHINENMPDLIKTDVVEALAHCQSQNHPFMATWDRDRVPLNILHLLSIKSGMLHTSFLLEKALMNRLKTGSTPAVLEHARMLLKYILAGAAKRDFLRDFQIDLTFMMAFHGIPAAGVLSVEMLKQEQTRQFTPDILPRSETIQDLSVFISALAAVEPNIGGNYMICKKAMKVLKKVLDKILSPQMPVQPSPETALDDPSLYFPAGNDAEFLTWLENIEWERGSLFNT